MQIKELLTPGKQSDKLMPKIVLQDTTDHHRIGCEYNLGGAAVVLTTVQALTRLIPEAEFISFIQFSDSFSTRHGIKVVKSKLFSARSFSLWESLKSSLLFLRCALWAILRKYFHINLSPLVNNEKLKHYREAAVIIDLSMDHFNDGAGIIPVIELTRDMLIGVLLGKPLVIYAQSPGPFTGRLASWVAGLALNRASLITVRDEISKGFLDKMAVTRPPVYLTADPAFLLEPASDERVREILSDLGIDSTKPLIGIGNTEGELMGGTTTWRGYKSALRSAYHLLEYCLPERLFLWLTRLLKGSKYYAGLRSQYSGKAFETIARIADHLAERMDASVLIVPHFVLPKEQSRGEEDGAVIAEAIYRLASNKDRVTPVTGKYAAQEIKGLIGQCDLFVSMKMHAAIAAVSQCIPAVIMRFGPAGPKFHGFMRMLGQERWLCEHISTDIDNVLAKIDDAWVHREEISKELESRQEALREKALLNPQLVKEFLDSESQLGDKPSERNVSG